MNKKRAYRNSESGQATIELAVMLLGMAFLILGIIFTLHLTAGSNSVLLTARCNAHRQSQSSAGSDTVSDTNDYAGWDYTAIDRKTWRDATGKTEENDRIVIPFALKDQIIYADANSIASANDNVFSATHSASEGLFSWTTADSNASVNSTEADTLFASSQTARQAAALVVGNGTYDSGLRSSGQSTADRKMRRAFSSWCGVSFDSRDLESLPGNRVYMPRTKH